MALGVGVVAGIAAFIAMLIALAKLAQAVGLTLYVDYGETVTVIRHYGRGESEAEEAEGSFTGLGYAIFAYAVLIGVIAGRYLFSYLTKEPVPTSFNSMTSCWSSGIIFYSIMTVLLDWIFGYEEGLHQILARVLNLCALGIAGRWGWSLYQAKLKVEAQSRADS